jgi:peptidoglycan-N-acetylglucosamine deacetylase
LATLLIVLLCLFLAQRLAFTVAAILPPRRRAVAEHTPSVKLLVAARDEESTLPALLARLEKLDYPAEQLSFVLASDGSRDATAELMESWCACRGPRARFLRLAEAAGKAKALQLAFEAGAPSELVAVYDADVRPRPDCLRRLAREFSESRVGLASGSCRPVPPFPNMVARYAALEMWVYQLVNQAGRDRLSLDPPAIGANCVYRAAALEDIGGFPPEAAGEDVEVSLAMTARRWKTLFLAEAVAETDVCRTLGQFWRQRKRWLRGLHKAGRRVRTLRTLSVVMGYADRLLWLAAVLAAAFGSVSWWWPAIYFASPIFAAWAGLHSAGEPRKLRFLLGCAPMFLVDLGSVCLPVVANLVLRRPGWAPNRTR